MLNNEAISALKDTIDALNLLLEQKERRVRTPEGQRRFGQPIGSVIIADGIGSVSAPEAELAADLVDDAFDAFDKEFGPREISAADNESAWYAAMTDEALSIFDRRAAHPERYNPSGQPGYGLRDGETELRVIRQPGPPRVADYETHTSAGLTMSEAIEVDGFIGMGASGYGKPLVPVGDPRPPKHVYRVMSVGEWEQAKERGYFKSDERMNLATDEGTVASLTTTGSFYVPPDGSDYRIVRLKYEDDDGWIRDQADGYIKTPRQIPFSRVDLVTEPLKNPRNKESAAQLEEVDLDEPTNKWLAKTLENAKALQEEGQGEPVSDPPSDPDADYEEPTYLRHEGLYSELSTDQQNFVSDWVSAFEEVKKFREEAEKIFNDEEPGPRYYHRAARAGLEMVENSPLTDKPLYRGMKLPREEVAKLEVGGDYIIPFGAFTSSRNEARQYMDFHAVEGDTKKVEIELDPGAKAIPMVAFQPGAIIGEHVTSGRFEIIGITEDGDITRVKIRHISTLEKGDLVKKEEVQEALPGMDDPYLLEQEFEDDGQGVLPGMPEPIKRDLIKIVGTGADTDIDYSAFSDVVTPYKPKPISIRSVVRREEREQSLLEIQELDPDAQAYETDTQENGGLFANALSRHSSPFSTSEAKGLVKISVNEQITRRILDHAAANPDFMAWLDNYGYKSMYLGAMRGYNGTTIRYHVPELIPYYENLTQEEWNAQSAGRDPEKLFWMPVRVNDEEQEYLMIDLGKVPVEIQKKIAKITMLSAALEGSKDPSTGGAINPRTIDYIEKMADSFPYSEVVARFLTRKIIDKWAMTSGDHDRDAVLLQQIAMAKFGLEDVSTDYHLGSYDPVKYKELGLFYEVFVDAMYENTQEFFRENGIKYVNAYRGMKWEPDQVPNWATGGQNIDIEERVNERLEDAIEYYLEEYLSDNESEIDDEVQQELDSDFNSFWRDREDEFWEDADFDLETASEIEKDDYRDEKRQEYYEQYWDAVRSRVLESWEENGRQLFYDQGGDSEVRADVMSEFADEMRPTGTIKVESQPLSSWSTNESTAGDFSSEGGFYGLVVSGRIPVERIFCTTLTGLGCLNEAELVVLGDYDELTVE